MRRYGLGGALVVNVLVGDTFIIQFLLDVIRPFPDYFNRKCFAPRARTQVRDRREIKARWARDLGARSPRVSAGSDRAFSARSPQVQMTKLYVMHADLYLVYRGQLCGKILVVSLMFATGIPFLYLLAAAFFWLAGESCPRHGQDRRPRCARDVHATRSIRRRVD